MFDINSIPGVVAFKDVRSSLTKHKSLRYGKRSLAQIKHIVVHHSLTLTGSAEAYARYHVNDLGWPGIGYHFTIEQDGTVKWCNDIESISYHVGNSNTSSLGIVLTGDFTKQEPTAAQWKSLYALLAFMKGKLSVSVDRVRGHQEMPGYSWKQCPALDMDALRGELNAGTYRSVKADFNNDQTIVIDKVAVPKPAPAPVKAPASMPDFITVQPGDTLWGIANNRAGLTVEDLLALNPGINPNELKVGQQIRIKKSVASGDYVVVEKGDTLWSIAKEKKVTVNELLQWNPGTTPSGLQPGDKILVKKPKTSANKNAAAKPAPAKPAPAKPKYNLPSGTVRQGAKGAAVLEIQKALCALNFYPDKGAKNNGCDGVYGAKTTSAVKRFQSVNCNPADGVYGPKTREAMLKLLK